MGDPINTIAQGTHLVHEIDIKKSRFITTLARTDSAEDARTLIDLVKVEHPQARHNCSAYRIIAEGRNPIQHFSDDGEPSGTAGAPMIEAIRLSDLWNVTAIVTRYFGGILLGGGGLIRAYSSSVSQALALAERVQLRELLIVESHIRLEDGGRIEAELRGRGAQVLSVDWASDMRIRIGISPEDVESMSSLLAQLSSGVAQFHQVGTQIVEVDVDATRS